MKNIHPLILTLERRDALSEEEKQRLEALPWRTRTFEAGETLIRQGTRPGESCLVLSGFAARSHDLASGQRQLAAIHMAGDFVDLHCFLLKLMDHSVVALSHCKAGFTTHEALKAITEEMPHLTRMLWASTVIDAAIQRAWLTSAGRRSAVTRLAHLICEMFRRLEAVGLTSGWSFSFPVSQIDLGDMLGLSAVHINRTLQDLRATGLVTWQKPTVTVEDWDGLARFAEFDPTYLSLFREPR